MKNSGNYYFISDLVLITGLSDRTIRKYNSSGILQGEKINGLWRFTPEQTDCFICHPSVRPSILAKHHSVAYDFLLDNKKSACETCVIVDLPGKKKKEIAEFFCCRISNENYQNVRFSFDGAASVPRIILKGDTREVLQLVNGYAQEQSLSQPVR